MNLLFDSKGCMLWATQIQDGDFSLPSLEGLPADSPERHLYERRVEQMLESRDAAYTSTAIAGLVHGSAIADIHTQHPTFCPGVDGFVTCIPQTALVVTGADCPPVLLYDATQHVLALVHSGRKGTALNIAGRAVRDMCQRYGSHAHDLTAYIGPGICQTHYQVSADIAREFAIYPNAVMENQEGVFLSLPQAIDHQLRSAGVTRVTQSGVCTYEPPETWHSFRRDTHQGVRPLRPRVQAFIALLR